MMNFSFINRKLILMIAISSLANVLFAETEPDVLASQREACNKNSAMEWDNASNKCVGRADARAQRHDVQDCNKIADMEARKACHLNLATSKTGITANPEEAGKKVSDLQNQSMMVNGAATVVSAINFFAKDKAGSSCMSKSILGITSLGGFATDLYLKSQARKKLKGLQDKFQADAKDSAYNTQVKALEYLKEEQGTVKEIASSEKKRQMLLMLGYGAAAVTAGYESFINTSCWKKEPEKKPEPVKPQGQVTEGPAPAAAPPANGDQMRPNDGPQMPPAAAPAAAPVADTGGQMAPNDGPQMPAATAPAAPAAPETKLVSVSQGNYKYNTIVEGDKTVAVVHNGEVYTNFKMSGNRPIAIPPPGGQFNYNTGVGGGFTVKDVGITSNFNMSSGRIMPGTGTAPVKDLGFGTNKIK